MKDELLIKLGSETFLKQVYPDMLDQFPVEELKTFGEFQSLIKNNYYNIYSFLDKKKIVGYFFAFADEENKVILIDYIAIKKEFQSLGYGSKLFRELKKIYSAYAGIFLEVQKENEANPNTIRRVKFYKKHGACKLKINYLFPSENGLIPMDLFYLPCAKDELDENICLKVIKNVFDNIHYGNKYAEIAYKKLNLVK